MYIRYKTTSMKHLQKIFFLVLVWLALAHTGQSQDTAVAVSSDPGPGLHIFLNWRPVPGAVKYNIYRKTEGASAYPATPVNVSPVVPAPNCAAIGALLTTPDSTVWKMVANALADSVLFNPCLMNNLPKPSEKYNRLLMLSSGVMPVALAAGLGYKDAAVVANTGYRYRVVALNASNVVLDTVANDLPVVAGVIVPIVPPTNVVAEPGDGMVQVRWTPVPGAAGYVLERRTHPSMIYTRVNPGTFASKLITGLNGDTLAAAAEGMMDYQRYNPNTGRATVHIVNGLIIPGPKNGTTYYYRVKSIDLFKRAGTASAPSNAAKPVDSTDPSVPLDLATVVDDNAGSVNIKWSQVMKDVNGHWEEPDSVVRYRVYRFPNSQNPDSVPSVLLGTVAPAKGLYSKDTTDSSPTLRSPYGNRTWWYRVRSVDANGNTSQWSTAVSAIVKDITPPSIVKNVVATGFEESISVKWQLNTEPDMASYMVYRSLCHLGDWVECGKRDTCRTWTDYDPNGQPLPGTPPNPTGQPGAPDPKNKLPCPCSGPFVFLGEITHDSAVRAKNAGHDFFDDRTIPAGSPLCYAYWIKAKDSSGNLSGSFPMPDAAERLEIVCQRLKDRTPPEPALIAGLFAQADQIRVEWIGPPTQDTRAYHVYRAKGTDPSKEPLPADYKWVGGKTVELPPDLPQTLTSPYVPPGIPPCDKISVQATPWMSEGYFEDKDVDPKLTYWYRVVGIDYDGNETQLQNAAAISTFTFTRKKPLAPVLDEPGVTTDPCAVSLNWSPVFNVQEHAGFIVYRSETASGPFTPIVKKPVTGNAYTDNSVVKGKTYWYRIALLKKSGQLSQLSNVKSKTP